ncbi:putative lipoprotein [Paenibacillus algicola]|uniref:Putative lipoprotein n=1 Tax=Paenibacillus algicola TaxID=2565926 RepID=A0A4P8XMX2_9BACL|nr:SUMF1/EgtB/PvdO family nonheme iron enzyme [Paenibacillus algicola]QCT02901.1 putative lipoprotein [Paenibacillus algicola]
MNRIIGMVCVLSMLLVTSFTEDRMGAAEEHFMIFVPGGTFQHPSFSQSGPGLERGVEVPSFYIGAYEVTQEEWNEVYEDNPSAFRGKGLPVEGVSWYAAVEYCNKRSLLEGLEPYYVIHPQDQDSENYNPNDPLQWSVTIQPEANGYRLPTVLEWEYAASGGAGSLGFRYSGSHNLDEVAWYWRNSGTRYLTGDWSWPLIENNNSQTRPVGSKLPNELGIYDMSGNVREWVQDWMADEGTPQGVYRIVKGGGWIGDLGSHSIEFRGKFEPSGFGPDQGFRVVRSRL